MSLSLPLDPVAGSPGLVRDTAASLHHLARVVGELGAQLVDLRSTVAWESPAGERFGAALGLFPTALDQVRHRYHPAANALDGFAAAHEVAIAATEREVARRREALDAVSSIEAEITGVWDAPEGASRLPELYERQRAAVARAQAATSAFHTAWQSFEVAAHECRERLRAAAADGIVDTGTYDVLRGARTVAQSVTTAFAVAGVLPTPVKAFSAAAAGVGGGVVLAGDVVLLLCYDEGSWWQVGETAAWNVLGRSAATMSRAAGIGAVKGVDGQWTGQRLRTSERLRRGRDELRADLDRQRSALRTPVADRHLYPPLVGGTRAPTIGPRQPTHVRTMRLVEDRIDAKVMGINDRWQMAAAGGGNAVVLQVSSSAITTAAAVRAQQPRVETARTVIPAAAERTRQRWEHRLTTRP